MATITIEIDNNVIPTPLTKNLEPLVSVLERVTSLIISEANVHEGTLFPVTQMEELICQEYYLEETNLLCKISFEL